MMPGAPSTWGCLEFYANEVCLINVAYYSEVMAEGIEMFIDRITWAMPYVDDGEPKTVKSVWKNYDTGEILYV